MSQLFKICYLKNNEISDILVFAGFSAKEYQDLFDKDPNNQTFKSILDIMIYLFIFINRI